MPSSTLTSLAILKVNVDYGSDYLEYLRPFVIHVLTEYNSDPITDSLVSQYIRDHFGLQIPDRTIEIVLKRLAKRNFIKKEYGVYRKASDLPDSQITHKAAEADRHIRSILAGLREFSQRSAYPIDNDERAVAAICAFLSEFGVECIKAYLRGTAIPDAQESHHSDIVLVSNYVQHIFRDREDKFNSFLVLVQGHMLGNALMCPDLNNAPRSYANVVFYLDTPLLIRRLGVEGQAKQAAAIELISLVSKLGGKIATFSHSRVELQRVLQGAANYLDSPNGISAIVLEARRRGTSKSDLLFLAESVDDELSKANIAVDSTPRYLERFQIDETAFEQILDDEVTYYNPRAREFDVNSVRSIYVLRGNNPALSVEKSKAVLVTSNSAFARAAWSYGQRYESSQDVSSVVSDFSLANMAWLKAPVGALSIPTTQLLAFSYAALEPSKSLLDKYMDEVDKLERKGTITERDHQLLRSSPLAYDELMGLTLGEDVALTEATLTETLARVTDEIKKEEFAVLDIEQKAHRETLEALASEQSRTIGIVGNIYWRSTKQAGRIAAVLSGGIVVLLVLGLLAGLGLQSTVPLVSWLLIAGSAIALIATFINLIFSSTVPSIHRAVQERIGIWLFKREAHTLGINLAEFGGVTSVSNVASQQSAGG